MDAYDPDRAPDSEEWLALDEGERMELVRIHHRRAGITTPNDRAHAIVHTIVENQLALGEPAGVPRTLRRLLAAGVDRHGALHAIGSVLAGHLHGMATGTESAEGVNERYEELLEELDARAWIPR